MTDVEIIDAIQELLSTPERFTRKAFARDGGGAAVSPFCPTAICFCLAGAEMLVEREHHVPLAQRSRVYVLIERAAREIYQNEPYEVNDKRGRAAVLRVLDHARKAAKGA